MDSGPGPAAPRSARRYPWWVVVLTCWMLKGQNGKTLVSSSGGQNKWGVDRGCNRMEP